MELWIRSQDKKLLSKIDTLRIGETNFLAKDDLVTIWGNDIFALGGYKSKERALEVLDEIQNRLMPYSEVMQDTEGITISYKNVSTIIYEMPKE